MSPSPDLPPVFWVGGGSGAGKTTVSRALAHRMDLAWYRIDAHAYEHRDRLVSRQLIEDDTRSYDERWLLPTARQLADEFEATSAKLMSLILEDLGFMDPGIGVIVEGPQLLPQVVAPHLADTGHAVWLLPTGGFRKRSLERRTSGAFRHTSDPATALERLLERNRLLDERTRDQVSSSEGSIVEVDGSRDLPAMITYFCDRFHHVLGAMPRFRTGQRRRVARQHENDAMVRNVLAFLAEVNPSGPPEPLPFACECERLGCDAIVECSPADHQAARLATAGW